MTGRYYSEYRWGPEARAACCSGGKAGSSLPPGWRGREGGVCASSWGLFFFFPSCKAQVFLLSSTTARHQVRLAVQVAFLNSLSSFFRSLFGWSILGPLHAALINPFGAAVINYSPRSPEEAELNPWRPPQRLAPRAWGREMAAAGPCWGRLRARRRSRRRQPRPPRSSPPRLWKLRGGAGAAEAGGAQVRAGRLGEDPGRDPAPSGLFPEEPPGCGALQPGGGGGEPGQAAGVWCWPPRSKACLELSEGAQPKY